MARFEELGQYKNNIVEKLIAKQEICKALFYSDRNFLDKPNITDPEALIYQHIFPFRFIPNKDDSEMKTYITMAFRKYRSINNAFKTGYIHIHIFTHKDLHRTDYGTLRTDFLLSQVDKALNKQSGIGIGKLEFDEADEYFVNDKYMGMYASYKPVDFN